MKNREKVEKTLKQEIGMSFTSLKDKTSLENGTLSYHIRNSEELEKKRGAVVHSRKCSECPLSSFCNEICVFKLLENETRREILENKMKGKKNADIALELGVHRSTVSYHVSKLEDNGLLREEVVEQLEKEEVL